MKKSAVVYPKTLAKNPLVVRKPATVSKPETSEDLAVIECPVCTDRYSGVRNKMSVECACGYSSCVECYKTYILSGITPAKCMSCGTHWSNKFLLEHFGTWIDSNTPKGYRTHLKNIIFEMQKARIPELAIKYGDISNFSDDRKRIKEIDNEIAELRAQANEIMDQVHSLEEESTILCIRQTSYRNGYPSEISGKVVSKIRVECKCPYDECKGLITSSEKEGKLKCIVDPSHLICKACRETVTEDTKMGGMAVKTPPGKKPPVRPLISDPGPSTSSGPSVHRCNPSTVKSVKAISEDSVPCPTCGAPVSKIDGCNAMWCTQCHGGFDYRTGKVTKTTHNPHLIEWELRNGNKAGVEEILRNPEDIPCDQIIPISQFQRYLVSEKHTELIVNITNLVREIEAEENGDDSLQIRRSYCNSHDFSMLMYLTNEYTEQELKNSIFRKQREDARLEARAQIFDTARTLLIERTRGLYQSLVEAEPASYRSSKTKKIKSELPLSISNTYRRLFATYQKDCEDIRLFINETFISEMTPLGSTSFPEITEKWWRR